MADLDDFFKKKDAKKKQKKPVAVKPERYLEEAITGDSNDFVNDESKEDLALQRTIEKLGLNDGEEWKEPGEDAKDYSSLKIKSITIKDKEDEIREHKQHKLQLEEEERRNSQASVWSARVVATPEESKKEITTEASKEEPEPQKKDGSKPSSRSESPAPPPPQPSSEPVKQKYVPPALRNAGASNSDEVRNLAPISMSALRSKPKDKSGAPKLDCEEEFPGLG